MKEEKKIKISLLLLPFWSPLTPPLGIACLKAYLKNIGYDAYTSDFNTISELYECSNRYLAIIKKNVPDEHKGNISMIAYDILTNHLNAYNNCQSKNEMSEIVDILIKNNYFYNPSTELINELMNIVDNFYLKLQEHLDKYIESHKSDVIGISVYSLTLGPSIFAFKHLKKRKKEIKTVMGGGIFADQLSVDSKELKSFLNNTPFIDYIMIGEGELLWKYLLDNQFNTKRVICIQDVKGTMKLSEAVIPDFSDFNLKSYSQLALYASRSCPFNCSFCSETVQWGKYRKKEVEMIVNEMQEISTKYNRRIILFGDSLLNPLITDLSRALIKIDNKVYWDAYIRVSDEAFDINIVKLWRKAGFYRARLGIESGSQSVLNIMNKRTNIKQIKITIKNLAEVGIKVTTYWVIGHPGETEEYFQETLDLLTEMKNYIYEADFHPFYFYPSGQVNSEQWTKDSGYHLLYPKEYSEKLIVPIWLLDEAPSRETIYSRVQRFAECCEQQGIPNPYSYAEIYFADRRWKGLHKNAVPMLADLT